MNKFYNLGPGILCSVNLFCLSYYSYRDWSYVPKYNNADDSEDYKVANGFSYHQGPVSYCLIAVVAYPFFLSKDVNC